MTKYSEKYWKKKQIFCYRVAMAISEDNNTCPYQYGEPFTGFWKQFGIEFDESIGIDDGGYISYKPQYHSQWKNRFNDVKVLAFFGNPGSFPSLESEQEFIKYIQFNEDMREKVRNFIWTRMGQKRNSRSSNYIAIHARVGSDMKKACERHFDQVLKYKLEGKPDHIRSRNLGTDYMGSAQCIGYNSAANFVEKFTEGVCYPKHEVAHDIAKVLHNNPHIRKVFVA